jgi:peptidoglycan LD-endopeptidase LytH
VTHDRWLKRVAALFGFLALSACEQVEIAQDRFRDLTPFEAYYASLREAGLDQTALGRDWVRAARIALTNPAPVSLPFREDGFIAPEEPGAMGYRVHIGRGQRLTVDVTLTSDEETRVFVDLFRLPEDPGDPARPIFSSDSVPGHFVHEPRRGGDFVLRLQPELLRGGRYQVTLKLEAQLAFPVQGRSVRSIQSVFGVEREGGRRSHHGIDIFARRGTPVLAAADGVVNGVELTRLGGKVVWLRDRAHGANLYYAHLDSQAVGNGQHVKTGDVLGFVGNTGNARTTPPHLHFGVYSRGEGPVDPDPYVRSPRSSVAETTVDLTRLGSWVRIRREGIRLRAAPGRRGEVLRELGRFTPLQVLGGSADYYRVHAPSGEIGYVAARLTEPADDPVGIQMVRAGGALRQAPYVGAPVIATLQEGAELPVLGEYAGFLYVRAPGGYNGWIDAQD